jgi:outer membrane protein TolC
MEQGAANKLDVVLASLERAQLEDSLSALALRRLRAEGALRELLDLSPEQSMAPTGEPGGVAEELLGLTPMGREAWVGEGLKARASLRETAAVLGRARADAYRADSELWPWFGWVELSYELKDGSTPLSWGFAFAVDLPIFAWTGAKTQAADALIRQRVQEHDSVITQIAREVEGAFAAEYGARQRLDALRETLLSAVNEAAAAVATARPELVPEADQMLRLEVASLRAQRRQLEALRDWVDARLRLHASVGR